MKPLIITCGLIAATLAWVPAQAQNAPSGSKAAQADRGASMKHSGEWRASKLIGLNVYNAQNEKIGDINEILLTSSGNTAGVVIGVGGFLGMGEHDVLVKLDQLKFVNEAPKASDKSATTDAKPNTTGSATSPNPKASDNRASRAANEKWYPDHAVMNATKDQLKGMPEFKYSNYN